MTIRKERSFLLTVTLILTVGAAIRAQSTPETLPPAFEVASVKSQPWTGEGSVGIFTIKGNTLAVDHADLYILIDFAYGVKTDETRISGGPAWAQHGILTASSLYQVAARTAAGATPTKEQFRLMMQTLLADRFQLKIHHVTKDIPVFNLIAAKNGVRLRENIADVKPSLMVSGAMRIRIVAIHAPLTMLIGQIQLAAGRPVIDKTALAGFYDFEVEWSSDPTTGMEDPSIFTALQERLGLKLEPAVAPFDTIAIDHAEKPSSN